MELGSSGVLKFRSLEVLKFRSSDFQKFRSSEVWKLGSLELGSREVQKFGISKVWKFISSEVQQFIISEIHKFGIRSSCSAPYERFSFLFLSLVNLFQSWYRKAVTRQITNRTNDEDKQTIDKMKYQTGEN